MAVNLHTKYRGKIEQQFTLASLVAGKASQEFDFTGVRTVKSTTIVTQALADYSRSTGFASAVEVADYIQDFYLGEEKSFNLKIDKLNELDQSGVKAAGPILRAEMDEQVTPYFDKLAIFEWAYNAGNSIVMSAASTKSNIISFLNLARAAFTNNKVPHGDRYVAIAASELSKVLESPEFIAVDTSIGKITENGVLGKACGFKVVEAPDDYLPTSCLFLAWHKKSVIQPMKLEMARIVDSEDFAGKKLQGLFYGDAFVVGPKAGGVYAALANGSSVKVATPTATQGGVGQKAEYTLASGTAGSTIKYTLDGTDPRYSASAVSVATGTVITLTAAVTGAKFVAVKSGMFVSAVLTQDCPIT